jgi:hypothetical protein
MAEIKQTLTNLNPRNWIPSNSQGKGSRYKCSIW